REGWNMGQFSMEISGHAGSVLSGNQHLGHKDMTIPDFDPLGAFPYAFTNGAFWRTFLSKQRDPTSFRSSLVQFAHMLNPVFFVDVVQILWRRCVRGGVYEQN
uniref:hypothetical protein n=1 Tax=Pseudorhizobium flavum TaxID=1335061 RepID=UPI002493A26B